jgi:hypothetical protein
MYGAPIRIALDGSMIRGILSDPCYGSALGYAEEPGGPKSLFR